MSFIPHFGIYDWWLVLVVTGLGTGVAYLKSPFWKSFLMLLPLPFSIVFLAVREPMNAACLLGLLLLMLYYYLTDWFYRRCRIPIAIAIPLAAAVFCLLGAGMKPYLSASKTFFWLVWTGTLVASVLVYRLTPVSHDAGSRTELAVYWKVPALLLTVLFVVDVKIWLAGFATMFPMVGSVGAYEARHCLKTVYRQVGLYGITFAPLAAACFLTEARLGIPTALALGWLAYLLTLWVLRRQWFPVETSGKVPGNNIPLETNTVALKRTEV